MTDRDPELAAWIEDALGAFDFGPDDEVRRIRAGNARAALRNFAKKIIDRERARVARITCGERA